MLLLIVDILPIPHPFEDCKDMGRLNGEIIVWSESTPLMCSLMGLPEEVKLVSERDVSCSNFSWSFNQGPIDIRECG